MFKVSEFGTAYADEFLATVSEGVVSREYKVVTQSSFGVTW